MLQGGRLTQPVVHTRACSHGVVTCAHGVAGDCSYSPKPQAIILAGALQVPQGALLCLQASSLRIQALVLCIQEALHPPLLVLKALQLLGQAWQVHQQRRRGGFSSVRMLASPSWAAGMPWTSSVIQGTRLGCGGGLDMWWSSSSRLLLCGRR